MIEQYPHFRCALSITGTALEQFELYVPEFIDLLKKLAATGRVEFLAETYAHSPSEVTPKCSATPSLSTATRWLR